MSDETPDSASLEQMCVLIRYLENDIIKEKLLAIVDTTGKQTRKDISDKIFEILKTNNLDPKLCIGFGFDGASALSGKNTGAATLLSENCPNSLYLHCASHCLNLVLCRISKISHIRNCFGSFSNYYLFS